MIITTIRGSESPLPVASEPSIRLVCIGSFIEDALHFVLVTSVIMIISLNLRFTVFFTIFFTDEMNIVWDPVFTEKTLLIFLFARLASSKRTLITSSGLVSNSSLSVSLS